MKRVLCLILAVFMTLSLAACGASQGAPAGDGGVTQSGKTSAKTNIMTSDELAERDAAGQPSSETEDVPSDVANYDAVDLALLKVPSDLTIYTDETAAAVTTAVSAVVRDKPAAEQAEVDAMAQAIEDAVAALVEKEGTEPSESGEEPTEPAETEPTEEDPTEPSETQPPVVSELDPLATNGYRYQAFLLSKAGTGNAVFSGEALLSAMDMWEEMIGEPDKAVLKKYVNRDYLKFDDTDTMKIIRHIWIDKSLKPSISAESRLNGLVSTVDMTSPSSTTEKNWFVAQATNGYIPYTPSFFTDETKIDLTSVVYASDVWKNGAKAYDTKNRIFYNADGSEVKTVMMRDEGLTYWDLGNAYAYCMYLDGGNYVMVVMPNKGVKLEDVNVTKLMNGELASKKAHVRFYMPEFTVESMYQLKLSQFSLPIGTVVSEILTGLPVRFEPVFSQIVKTSITHSGVCSTEDLAPAATPIVDYNDDLDVINIVCDRPFIYYIGDAENEDIAFFGVVNEITEDMAVDAASVNAENDWISMGEMIFYSSIFSHGYVREI